MKNLLLVATSVVGVLWAEASLAQSSHFNPDSDPSRIAWFELAKLLGPVPDVRGQRFGVVLKTQTNEYWRLMAAGYRKRAAADGVKLDIQAAQSETDQKRQLAAMETMIGSRYKGLLISPQSSLNLQPAVEDAIAANVTLVNVDGAVVDNIAHFVGPMNREMGVKVANWFIQTYPNGGKVAVIEGQAGVLSTIQRTAGFRDTILAATRFALVASVSGEWQQQKAHDVTMSILEATPDLIGIYCNNDVMALGAVQAVKDLHLLNQVRVFGTDGTGVVYDSIKAGDVTGTVSIFPMLIGDIGLEIAERLSAGQVVPRVVETPQAVVTRDNVERYAKGGLP